MIIDKSLIMSDDQAVTVDAASAVVIDNIKPGGMYDNLWLFLKVGPADFGATVSIDVSFQTSDDNFNADTTTLFTKNFVLAEMTANAVLMKIRVPLGVKRYLRMYYDVNTSADAGAFYAALVPDVEEHIAVS